MRRNPKTAGHCVAGCELAVVPGTDRCPRHPHEHTSTGPDLFTVIDARGKTIAAVADEISEEFARGRPVKVRTRSAAPDTFRDHPPSAPRSATSKRAAAIMGESGKHRTLTERIHDYITSWGATGRTRAEIARFLPSPDGTQTVGARLSSVCAAVDTLKKQGLVGVNANHTRVDPETRMSVEVLVDEAHVERWRGVPRAARVSPMTPTRRPAGE